VLKRTGGINTSKRACYLAYTPNSHGGEVAVEARRCSITRGRDDTESYQGVRIVMEPALAITDCVYTNTHTHSHIRSTATIPNFVSGDNVNLKFAIHNTIIIIIIIIIMW
jgi:hypothetical protein